MEPTVWPSFCELASLAGSSLLRLWHIKIWRWTLSCLARSLMGHPSHLGSLDWLRFASFWYTREESQPDTNHICHMHHSIPNMAALEAHTLEKTGVVHLDHPTLAGMWDENYMYNAVLLHLLSETDPGSSLEYKGQITGYSLTQSKQVALWPVKGFGMPGITPGLPRRRLRRGSMLPQAWKRLMEVERRGAIHLLYCAGQWR